MNGGGLKKPIQAFTSFIGDISNFSKMIILGSSHDCKSVCKPRINKVSLSLQCISDRLVAKNIKMFPFNIVISCGNMVSNG